MGKSLAIIADENHIYEEGASLDSHIIFWGKAIKQLDSTIKIKKIEDVARTPTELLSKIITSATTPEIQEMNMHFWEEEVAPVKDIERDYNSLAKRDNLILVSQETANSFTKRAIAGHAQKGHGKFNYPSPNTESRDVIKAIGDAPEEFQNQSQQSIDSIVQYVEKWFYWATKNAATINKKSRITMLQDQKGQPLNGLKFLTNTPIDMLEFARGFYFGSLMDNFSTVRKAGLEKYAHQMGGGGSYLTNMKQLKEFGIGLKDLADIKHKKLFRVLNYMSPEKKILILKNLGIIEDEAPSLEKILQGNITWEGIKNSTGTMNLEKNSGYSGCYIRTVKGKGVGDDIAIFLSAFLPQTYTTKNCQESHQAHQSRMIGTLLADQIDTLEKGSSIFMPRGQDEMAGQYINYLFKKSCQDRGFRKRFGIKNKKDGEYTLIDEDTIIDFTAASANTRPDSVHSSQRWLYKEVEGTCAISEYMKYVYFQAQSKNRKMHLSELASFNINMQEDANTARFTYQRIPLEEIKYILGERLRLVSNPKKRGEKIAKYFEQTRSKKR